MYDRYRTSRRSFTLEPAARTRRPVGLRAVPWRVLGFSAVSLAAAVYIAGSASHPGNPTQPVTIPPPGPADPGAADAALGVGSGSSSPSFTTATVVPPAAASPTTPSATPSPSPPSATTNRPTTSLSKSKKPSARATTSPRAASGATSGTTSASYTCTYHYTFDARWSDGFTANVTLTNTSSISLTGWDAEFNLSPDVTVTQSWDATLDHAGNSVLVTPLSYNNTLKPGQSVSFGFNASSSTKVSRLDGFVLASLPCGRV
jgi:cellulase/cellobiase CelA1